MIKIALFATDQSPIDTRALSAAVGTGLEYVTPSAYSLRQLNDGIADNDLCESVKDVDAIVFRVGRVTRPIIEAARRLKIVAVHGVGTDAVDLAAASRQKVHVTITPGANAPAVAEFVFCMLLLALRQSHKAVQSLREVDWAAAQVPGTELFGKTLGVLGYGSVGSRVAKLAAAFGMEVVIADHPTLMQRDFQSLPLSDLARLVDFLIISVPRRPTTIHLVSEAVLRSMRQSSILVNVARGDIVDEDALKKILDEGRIAAALLDVFATEPALPTHPLVSHPRVLATPHIAGFTNESLARIASTAGADIKLVLNGHVPLHAVNEF